MKQPTIWFVGSGRLRYHVIDVQELLVGCDAAVGTREIIALEGFEPEFRADAHVGSPGARVGLNGRIATR